MKVRILVVDDDEDLLFIAQQYLTAQDSDFVLVQTRTAQDALLLLDEEDFDAVICDFYLGPGEMNGLEILGWMRDRGCATPFIIFTGRSREEVAIQALNLGADYYLEKGDDLESLFIEIGYHIKSVVRSKRTEEALHESEQKYRTLVQSINDLIFVIDSNNKFIQYYSERSEDLLTPPEFFIGKHITDVLPPIITESYLTLAEEVRITGERRSFDYELEVQEKTKWYTANLDLHEDNESIVAIIEDISERKRAEEELKDAERDWCYTFDSIPDMVTVLDNNFQIVKANKATSEFTGIKLEELIGKKCYEVMHDSSEPFPVCPHLKTLETDEIASEEIYDPHIGIPILVTTSPIIDETGNKTGVVHIAKDISERLAAEETIKTSEAGFRAIFQRAGIGMALVNLDQEIREVNIAFQKFLGYDHDELVGMKLGEISHLEDSPKDATLLKDILDRGEESYQMEKRYIRKDGEIVWARLTVSLIKDVDGNLQNTIGMVEDITDWKKAELAVIESEEKYRTLVESSQQVILILQGQEATIVYANEGVAALGYTPEDMTSLKINNLLQPEDQSRFGKLYQDITFKSAEPQPEGYEIRVVRKDGGIAWMIGHPYRIIYNGQPAMQSLLVDITDRKQAEQSLKESETRFRGLFEHAGIGMALVELEGKILEANPSLLKFLGYEYEELVGMFVDQITDPEDVGIDNEYLQPVLQKEEQGYNFEKRYVMKDGTVVWGRLTVSIVRDMTNTPQYTIGMVEDITEEKRAKAQLQKEQTRVKEYISEVKQSEEKYKLLYDNLSDGLIQTDVRGTITLCSPRAAEIFGTTPDDVVGTTIWGLIHLDDRERIIHQFRNSLEQRETVLGGFDVKGVRRDRSEFYYHVTNTILMENDKPAGYQSLIRDITHLKETEEALRQSETKLRNIFEESPMGIDVFDASGNLIEANKACLDIYGVASIDDLRDFNLFDDPNLGEEVKERIRNGETIRTEVLFDFDKVRDLHLYKTTKTGVENIGGVIASLGRDSDGLPIGFIAQMQNITKRKKAERALKESEARFRSVFESAAIGMTIVDSDDHLIDANRAYQELLGYELDELRDMLTADFTHSEDVLVDAHLFAEILEGKRESYRMEKRYFRKDGTPIYVSLSVTSIRDSSDQLKYVVGMTEDITSRKQTEKELLLSNFAVERSTDTVLRILPDGGITYANQAACLSLGYSKDELLQMTIFDIDSEIEPDTWVGEWPEFKKKGSLMKQSVHKTKDAEFFQVEINANYVNIDGEEYNFAFARDISERKQAQEILAQSEKRKDSMIRAAPVGIGLASDRVMTFVSDTFVNMIEYTREELLGQDARMLYESDEEYQRVGRVKYEQIREQGTGALETRMVTKSGRIINVDLRSTPIDIDDSSSEVTFTAMDITARKETEEKLEKRTHELLERIKEINSLYFVSDILKNTDRPLKKVFSELIETIPAGYQYPDITFVRISLDDEYTSQNFAKSIWMQSANIVSSGTVVGTIEVFYSQSKPKSDEGPFLNEERDLINTLANQIGEFIERVNTQRELRESERKHRTIVESMQDLIFVYDSLDYYTEYYAASTHLLYTDHGNILEEHVSEVLPPEIAKMYLQNSNEVRTTGNPVTYEYALEIQGENYWFESTLSLNEDEGSIIAVVKDITQRKIAQDETQNQRDFLQKVLDSLTHPFYVIDANNYEIKLANKAARLGSLDENPKCYSLTHQTNTPCDGSDHPCPLLEIKRTGKPVTVEHRHFDENGDSRDFQVQAFPVFDDKGVITQMIEYDLDITEHKQMDRALEESEQRFRDLYEKAPLSYQTLNEEGQIINANRAWLNSMGYSAEEVEGKYFGDFLTHKSRERFPELFEQFKQKGTMINAEYELVRSNGVHLIARFNGIIVYDENGKFKQTHCIFQDVTELKIADDLLRRQKEELSELAHVMSHDLGNKMRNIRSLVSLVKHNCEDESLDRIDQIALRSNELLQTSADLADAGLVIEKKELVNLNDFVQEIANTTIPDHIKYVQDELSTVQCGREQIGQIFQNLFENAVQHGSPTSIEVKSRRTETGQEIRIINDGSPIPPENREKVFLRGFSTKSKGTGIGLSIVKKLVEAHGWRVSLLDDSKTTFCIIISEG